MKKNSNIFSNITEDIINNIFYNNSDNKYQDLMLKLDKDVILGIINIIKESIKILDQLYAKSPDRKRIFNISDSKVHRSIMTNFGKLEFDRIYYYSKNDNNSHFFLIHFFVSQSMIDMINLLKLQQYLTQ